MTIKKSRLNILIGIVLLVLTVLALVLGAGPDLAPPAQAAAADGGVTWAGMYTNQTSYSPGDTIDIFASAPDEPTAFRLVRLDTAWTEITRTLPVTVGLQPTYLGSFLEYPAVSLSGRVSFTLEGWYHPTLLGQDPGATVLAGQMGLGEAAAGIVIREDGRLAAYVSDTPTPDPAKYASSALPSVPQMQAMLDSWHHVAMTYDGAVVRLYLNGTEVVSRTQTGTVAAVDIPFRVGARAEAPGNQTGVLDGRIDSWALWPGALSQAQVTNRYNRGLVEANPEPFDLNTVDLYLAFEGPYGDIDDSSTNAYTGTVYNHGVPGVTGVISASRGFRLNSDQLVDADWDLTVKLTIPPNLDSGMYAIQALTGPDYLPDPGDSRLTVRAIAVRPAPAAAKAPIAVVLPTNTWNAYNDWPGTYAATLIGGGLTAKGRYPGDDVQNGGNNSAYKYMLDQISPPFFQGQRRPGYQFSVLLPGTAVAGWDRRAPNSMYLIQWLDAMGFDYDVYSDDDFGNGLIEAADHKVLMPHGHHEYWTDGMLANLTQFLNDGGSVVMPAGNVFSWRAVYNDDQVMEVRKFHMFLVQGEQDLKSGIDGLYIGKLQETSACNASGNSYRELGVRTHLVRPCKSEPYCFGEWEAQNTDHWLWQGSGLQEEDLFGIGRPSETLTPTYAVGHESDTWLPGMLIPGLSSPLTATILAEGVNFNHVVSDTIGQNGLLLDPNRQESCGDVKEWIGEPVTLNQPVPATRGGTILHFEHLGGGQVLVISASATPWALESDPALSGLLFRALDCFANKNSCGYGIYLPIGRRP